MTSPSSLCDIRVEGPGMMAYPCTLIRDHDGPHFAKEIASSKSARERYLIDKAEGRIEIKPEVDRTLCSICRNEVAVTAGVAVPHESNAGGRVQFCHGSAKPVLHTHPHLAQPPSQGFQVGAANMPQEPRLGPAVYVDGGEGVSAGRTRDLMVQEPMESTITTGPTGTTTAGPTRTTEPGPIFDGPAPVPTSMSIPTVFVEPGVIPPSGPLTPVEPTKQREGDQVLPTVNETPDIQSLVIADIYARRQVGIERYGTALQAGNGRDAMRDLYEELMDAVMYIKQVMVERDLGLHRTEHP